MSSARLSLFRRRRKIMAAATVASSEVITFGNKVAVQASFAAVSDTNTWAPGLTLVEACFLTNGANDVDIGATYSGGTVTFQCAGDMANVRALAIGV
jgi:hypothetical protein